MAMSCTNARMQAIVMSFSRSRRSRHDSSMAMATRTSAAATFP